MKFVVDSMLGKLARHLRIFGYDTIYTAGLDDDKILTIAKDDRLIITRDKRLAERAKAKGLRVFLTSNGDLEHELKALVEGQIIKGEEVKIGSRCSLCNTELRSVKLGEVWVCPWCGQKYWLGGHWANIRDLMRRVGLLDRDQ
jgi:hypothetical protein